MTTIVSYGRQNLAGRVRSPSLRTNSVGEYSVRARAKVERQLAIMTAFFTDTAPSPYPDLSLAIRTLVSGQFQLDTVQQESGYDILVVHRFDEFGVTHRYCFAIAEEEISSSLIDGAQITAERYEANLVVVGTGETELPNLEWEAFINVFGGPVFGLSPLEPQFRDHLNALGHNRLPSGLCGKASDLFEEYVRSALEFVIGGRVVPYGQKRSFEPLPDGIIPPQRGFYALYDAKAYKNGYKVTAGSLRQFESYVRDFSDRYSAFFQPLSAFVVVSGHFPHRHRTLEERSRDFFDLCRVPLSFLSTDVLSEMIEILAEQPRVRRAIRWSRLFSDPVVQPARVKNECQKVLQDGVLS